MDHSNWVTVLSNIQGRVVNLPQSEKELRSSLMMKNSLDVPPTSQDRLDALRLRFAGNVWRGGWITCSRSLIVGTLRNQKSHLLISSGSFGWYAPNIPRGSILRYWNIKSAARVISMWPFKDFKTFDFSGHAGLQLLAPGTLMLEDRLKEARRDGHFLGLPGTSVSTSPKTAPFKTLGSVIESAKVSKSKS